MPEKCDDTKPFTLEGADGPQCLPACNELLPFVNRSTMNCVEYCANKLFISIAGVQYCAEAKSFGYQISYDNDSVQQFVHCPANYPFVNLSKNTCIQECSTNAFFVNVSTLDLTCLQRDCSTG